MAAGSGDPTETAPVPPMAEIQSVLTNPVSLFMGHNNAPYWPLYVHYNDIQNEDLIGNGAQVNHAKSFVGNKVDKLMDYGYDVSNDHIRTNLGCLWYTISDGSVKLQHLAWPIPGQSSAAPFSIEAGNGIFLNTPFIIYDTSPTNATEIKDNQSLTSTSYLHMTIDPTSLNEHPQYEIAAKGAGSVQGMTTATEKFRVYVNIDVPTSEATIKYNDYKKERFFNFIYNIWAAQIVTMSDDGRTVTRTNPIFYDYVTEIGALKQNSTGAGGTPWASITSEILTNEELPKQDLDQAVQMLDYTTNSDVLLPNFNCYDLHLFVDEMVKNLPQEDDQYSELANYLGYLKQLITFNSVSAVTSLGQTPEHIQEYVEQYMTALETSPQLAFEDAYAGLYAHMTKLSNIVIMQSVLEQMQTSKNSFYFPAGLTCEMLTPIYNEKSLLKSLDRWNLDYVVLKAIAERVGEKVPFGQYDPVEIPSGVVDGSEVSLFSGDDEILACPGLSYSSYDTGNPHVYTNRNSFNFYDFSSYSDSSDNSFCSLYEMQVKWPTTFVASGFGMTWEDIYSYKTNHMFLDVPGSEDPLQFFVKRGPAEDFSAAISNVNGFFSETSDDDNLKSVLDFIDNGGKTRTFTDILDGKKANSEIVYWRIQKKDSENNLIQNIFIPNHPEFNPKYFIDSQIINNEEYKYVIYAWCAIYGTKYNYTFHGHSINLEQTITSTAGLAHIIGEKKGKDGFDHYINQFGDDVFGGEEYETSTGARGMRYSFDFSAHSKPCVKMVEIPYSSLGGLSPGSATKNVEASSIPSPPNVEVVPYENTDTALLFLLNASAGTVHTDFIIGINPEDNDLLYDIWQIIINNSSLMDNDGTILFNTKDVKRYEIYRIEEKPKSYSDFTSGKLIGPDGIPGIKPTNISYKNEFGEKIIERSTSVSFKDTSILPNKKYYYTFRVIDDFGHFSNPTAVYEVEIVNDGGTIYPIINIVDFDFENNLQATKTMRKYLRILPTLQQSLLDLDTTPPDYETQTAGTYLLGVGQKTKIGLPELQYKIFEDKNNEVVDGKKKYFKVKLTSKKTGKQVDINLKFKINHNETAEEDDSIVLI